MAGISIFPPLIEKKHDKYTGFEIELWEKIAQSLSLDYQYKELSFKNLLPAVSKNKLDVAFAGITRTEEREKIVNFSHFTLNSGLLILLSKQSKKDLFTFIKHNARFSYQKISYFMLLILAILFLFANIIWFIELKSEVFHSSYLTGIGEALWWAVTTVSTVGYGDFVPHTAMGRLFSAFIIIIGISAFGLLIAKLSSLFTLIKMQYQINSYQDLAGKKVATKAHTTAQDELYKIGAKVIPVNEIEHAYKLLEAGKVDAVVFDAPVIRHFYHIQKDQNFTIAGDVFSPQTYGFALPDHSALRESINQEILRLRESGEYDTLLKKWFGDASH